MHNEAENVKIRKEIHQPLQHVTERTAIEKCFKICKEGKRTNIKP
jgi:hypothetical protein